MEHTSIGIIGGADGPTQVFVTSSASRGMLIAAAGAVVLVIALLLFWFLGRKR